MANEGSYVALALKMWKAQIERADKLFGSLSSEDALREIAPGRNRLLYLWGTPHSHTRRERTPLPRNVIERLPNLKLIASTGSGNAAIDVAAAGDQSIGGIKAPLTEPPFSAPYPRPPGTGGR